MRSASATTVRSLGRSAVGASTDPRCAAVVRPSSVEDLVDRVLARESVELELALVVEAEVAGALCQLLHNGRREDLAAAGLVGDARGEDDVLAVEVGLLLDRLAGVEAHPESNRAGVVVS